MSFKFRCPKCQTELEAQDEWKGMETNCPSCNATVKIPKIAYPELTPHRQPPPILTQYSTVNTNIPSGKRSFSGKTLLIVTTIFCVTISIGMIIALSIFLFSAKKEKPEQNVISGSNSQAEIEAMKLGISNNGVVFRSDVRTKSGDVIRIFEQDKFYLFSQSDITNKGLTNIQKIYNHLQNEIKKNDLNPMLAFTRPEAKRDIIREIGNMLSEQGKAQKEYFANLPQRLVTAMEKKDDEEKNKLMAFDGLAFVSVWNKETYSWREPGKEILGVFGNDILKGHQCLAIGYVQWNNMFIFYVKPFKKNANIPQIVTITNDDILAFEIPN